MPIRASAVVAFVAAKLVPGLAGVASIPVWLAMFGPSVYGQFATAWVVVTVTQALATGWLRQASLRFAGAHQGFGQHPILALVAPLALSGVAAVALLGFATTIPRQPGTMVAIVTFTVSLGVYGLTQIVSQRDGRNWKFAICEVIRAGLSLALGVAGGLAGLPGLQAILFGAAVANGVATFVGTPAQTGQERRSWDVANRSWRFGWPMSIWLACSFLTLYVDRTVLAGHVSSAALGTYAAVSDMVVRGLSMAAMPIVMVLHPIIMRAYNSGQSEAVEILLTRWSRRMLFAVLMLTAMSGALGPAVLSFVGVDEADPVVVALLTLGVGLWQYALLAHKWLEMRDRTRTMMIFIVVAVLVEVGWSLITVRMWGPRGTAGGMLIGTFTYLALVRLAVRRMGRARDASN
jgi:O-antigen/teichoic acid export membrane protein